MAQPIIAGKYVIPMQKGYKDSCDTPKNMGLAEARRVGVNSSKGSYIGFVDGDDWIDTEMYEKLYQIAKEQNVDLVTSAGYRNYENGMAEGTLKDNMPEGLYDMEKNNLVNVKYFSYFLP